MITKSPNFIMITKRSSFLEAETLQGRFGYREAGGCGVTFLDLRDFSPNLAERSVSLICSSDFSSCGVTDPGEICNFASPQCVRE